MSYSVYHQYSCIQFEQEITKKEIRLMLAELAHDVLHEIETMPQTPSSIFWSFEEIACDLEDESKSKEEALKSIEDTLWLYLDQIKVESGKTSLVVRSADDREYHDSEIAIAVSKHLFAKTGNSHFILRSAAFDFCHGYSHQWIGYFKNGEVVLQDTDKYFQRMFEAHPSLMTV
jgi:hypothetical protein